MYCYKNSFADNALLYPPDTVIKYLAYGAEKLFENSPKNEGIAIGDYGWNIIKENGAIYAKSSNIENNSSSAMTVTITGPCVLYYEMAVSSEEGADMFIMRNNNKKIVSMSGGDTYTFDNPYKNCIVLGEGENIITWRYTKDDVGNEGEDCAWVKNLRVADIGDADLDGKLDITDVVLGQKYLADSSAVTDILGEKVLDYNCDSIVDKADIAHILKKLIMT